MPVVQYTFPSSCSRSNSFQPSTYDVQEQHHDYSSPVSQHGSVDWHSELAEAGAQQQLTLHDQAATNALQAYNTPPRPCRQVQQVVQNPSHVGSITDQLLKEPQPPSASAQFMSCNTIHTHTTEQLLGPVISHQHWPAASSILLRPQPGDLAIFRGDRTPHNQQQPPSGPWTSRQNDITCGHAQLRIGALHPRSSTGTFDGSAKLRRRRAELPPVTSRDPRRQACRKTAVNPEVGASPPKVSL